MPTQSRLVTRNGECFEAIAEGKDRADNRDGVLHYFHLVDLVRDRGTRRVSVFRGGPRDLYAPSVSVFDRRIDTVLLNTIRRGFDSGELTFDAPEEQTYREIRLRPSDFGQQPRANDQEIRQFILHDAYWLSYRHGNRFPIEFESEANLEYLGAEAQDIRRNQWVLEQDGLLEQSNIPGNGRPKAQLVRLYESPRRATVHDEQVFPKGTQYEAFKVVMSIMRTAAKDIVVVDNYLDSSILEMIEAVSSKPTVRLLTFKPSVDFKVALAAFQKQYGPSVEVKLHQREVHDRVIIIDDKDFFSLGASVKDLGDKLSMLNKLEDSVAVARLRSEFQAIWESANPL